jgi:hypothetical protein
MTPPATLEIMDRGIRCLVDSMGATDTERFISVLLRERFDYTLWRRHFDDVPADDWNHAAAKHARVHPFRPKKPQRPLPVLSCSPASPS